MAGKLTVAIINSDLVRKNSSENCRYNQTYAKMPIV